MATAYLMGVFFIIMGLLFSVFHARMGKDVAEMGYNLWHWDLYRSGFYIKTAQIGFLLSGIFFAVLGVLFLLFPSNFGFK